MEFEDEDEKYLLKRLVRRYMDWEYWDLVDIDKVLERAKVIEERNLLEFDMYFMTLYLDSRDYSFVDAHPRFPNNR